MGNVETIALLVKVNLLRLSADDLGLVKQYLLSGYNLEDWVSDLKSRLAVVGAKERESKLKLMETKLHDLLSADKKTELEIDDIMKAFKGEI